MLELFKKYGGAAIFLIFLVVGLALYADSFGNRFFWDDEDLITKNYQVQNFQIGRFFADNEIAGVGQVSNYWRPLLLISFALDYKVWGLSPLGFHLTNTFLHVLAAWLAFCLLFKLLESFRPRPENFWLAFLPAFLFLIHPLQTEAVTYVSGRGDPLVSVFTLLALIFYAGFRRGEGRWKLPAAMVFSVFGFLVKEQMVFLPLLLVLLEAIFFIKDISRKSLWQAALSLAPFVALSAIYGVLRLTVLNFNDILSGPEYYFSDIYNTSLWPRLFTFCLVMLQYFGLLFAPFNLHMAREVAPVSSFFSWPVIGFLVLAGALAWLSAKLWRRERLVAFGLGWFFLILLPHSNIIKINRPMYEHWLYLAMLGFWLALFAVSFLFYEKIRTEEKKRLAKTIFVAAFSLLALLFSFLTISRNLDWRDPITFYEKNLRYTPNSFIQHNNLGMAYSDAGRLEEAIAEYKRAIAIKDIYPQVHYNLANSLSNAGQTGEAEKEWLRAIEMSPGFWQPHNNLVLFYVYESRYQDAEEVLNKAEKDFTDYAPFWYVRGLVYYRLEKYDEAEKAMLEALAREPGNRIFSEALAGIRLKK